MSYSRKIVSAAILISSTISLTASMAMADTETSTETTTTVTTTAPVTSYTFPATGTYIVVDPMTGTVRGLFDPVSKLVEGRPLTPGLVVSDKVTGNVIAVVDSSGNVVDVSSAPAVSSLITSIDARRAEIDRLLADALAKGTMSPDQASNLRNELDKLAAEEALAKQANGGLTYAKALALAYALNNFDDRVVLYTHSTPVAPLIGPNFITRNNQLVLVDNIAYRKLELERRINDEYSAGRLSSQQVARLKSDLDEISAEETRYRKNGELSSAKEKTVSIKLDKLKIKVDQDVAIINQKRSNIGIKVD